MNAGKTLIIIEREYLTRVRNKTFILSTFLLPIMMIVFIFGSVFFAVQSVELRKVAVVNDPGYFATYMRGDSSRVIFDFATGVDSSNYVAKGFDGILYLPKGNEGRDYLLQSKKQFGLGANEYVEQQINKAIENHLLEEKGINKQMLDSIATASSGHARLNNKVSDEAGGSKKANAGLAYGIGFGSGILIYITMFIFGSMVMRGVAEEKTNRIAEVIVSSCKPFELMLGKIIGIAGVGLTQFLLWIGLILILMTSVQFFIPAEIMEMARQNPGQLQSGREADMALRIMNARTEIVESVNWVLILSSFLFYFLGGYLFYASLFAAIGSVINEDPQEAQSLMLPITMPIIFGFIILSSSMENPGSTMAVWGSIIPFTSPIVMMGRIPFGVPETVPYWQLGLSMLLLIGGFLGTTWFAGKVYRTGILMYGKKATWKEMVKWAFRKN